MHKRDKRKVLKEMPPTKKNESEAELHLMVEVISSKVFCGAQKIFVCKEKCFFWLKRRRKKTSQKLSFSKLWLPYELIFKCLKLFFIQIAKNSRYA